MGTKGLEGDISTTVETIPEKRALLRQMVINKKYFNNFTLEDLIKDLPHDRTILIRIDVSKNGRSSEISIVEEL